MENASYDFSEQNLVCCTDPSFVYLTSDRCDGGGDSFIAADTLIKKGTRLESCQPYNTGTINTESCNDSCTSIKVLNGYRLVTNNGSDISRIKDAIYDYGPVSIAYWIDPDNVDHYLSPGNIYYYPSCPNSPNHLVSIVGWNDSIQHPFGVGYGAWIVKNNWGTSWGNGGYFYLCYGSANMQEVAYYEYQNYNPDEKLYYWDEAGWVANIGDDVNHVDHGWMASVFNSTQSGNITSVDFWATSSNAQYQIYVYDGNFSTQLISQSGSCSEVGYYSIPLDSPVHRDVGQQFTVAVKMTTPDWDYPIPIEYVEPDEWEPTIQTGISFIRIEDSDTWEDAEPYGWNVCLRTRIVNDPYILTLTPSPPAGGNPTGAGTYNASTNATISANTSPCYTFTGWTPFDGVANASAENTTVSMTQNRGLIANFSLNNYTLTIDTTGSGGGTFTPDSGTSYPCGTVVNLNASPNACSTFSGWSGSITNSSANTTITMDSAKSVTANFSLNGPFFLNISVNGNGSVTSPSGTSPYGPYNCSEVVSLTAEVDPDYVFISWSPDTGTIANPYSPSTNITMYDNYSITANFGLPPSGNYGDADNNDLINATDISFIKAAILGRWNTPNPGTDGNSDGLITATDISYVKAYILGRWNGSLRYEVTYDFLSGAGSDKWAKINTISSNPPNDIFDNESGWSPASPTDYSNIALNDSNVWTVSGTSGNYSAIQCKFTIVSNPANITSIGITLNGSSNINGSTLRLRAWNFTTSSWRQLGSDFSITTNISNYTIWSFWGKVYSNYIDPSNHMFILASLNTSAASLNIDYIKLSVAHP